MENKNNRIGILDGFRALAILAVILFHFFSRYVAISGRPTLYPYNNKYNFFSYGYCGVNFFFIISGFVIFYTLERTKGILDFWKHRLIRLWPSLLAASLLTYVFLITFDAVKAFPEGHKWENLIFSLTFLPPGLTHTLSNDVHFEYVNGSYWSLWPELQFYLFVSLLFYLGKNFFIQRFVLLSGLLICLNHLIRNVRGSNAFHLHLPDRILKSYNLWFEQCFNLIDYLPFFCCGAFFYVLYQNKQNGEQSNWFIKIVLACFIWFSIYSGIQPEIKVIYTMMYVLFFMFIYYPQKINVLQRKIWVRIGMSSYFLYLIHENIGVVLVQWMGNALPCKSWILPALVIAGLTLFSIIYTERIERKLIKWLRSR